MKQKKQRERLLTDNKIRKKEWREERRERVVEQQQKMKKCKWEADQWEAERVSAIVKILSEDRTKNTACLKRNEIKSFIAAFSFITNAPLKKRDEVPEGWKFHSYNRERRYIAFFREFCYPYPVPETLIFASLEEMHDERSEQEKQSGPPHPISLARKWLQDITSGQSFHKQNKAFFTRAEACLFVTAATPYAGLSSLAEMFFLAKCKARGMNDKLASLVSAVFAWKFPNDFTNPLLGGFLDLIARHMEYNYDKSGLENICDFVCAKVVQPPASDTGGEHFSFSGRTINSLIALTNEWHTEMARADELNAVRQRLWYDRSWPAKGKSGENVKWNGMLVQRFRYETEEKVWVVEQITSLQRLVHEGRVMRNCVVSYAEQCGKGDCALFSVFFHLHGNQKYENTATLEVRKDRTLVQAKGKGNTMLTPETKNIVKRWASENRIKIRIE